MASGYLKNGVDLDDLCEPYVASKAVNSNNQDLSTFSVNGTAMTNRYQKANTDTWANVVTLPLKRDGVSVEAVSKGCFPTQTKFAELTSTGSYEISRTDTELWIGDTSYPASHFRNGVVPTWIGIMICGAGGGSGGYGCNEGNKSGYNVTPGGAGGGGAIKFFVAKLSSFGHIVTVGYGGTAGANGSSDKDSRPSTGSTGGSGSYSGIQVGSLNIIYGDYHYVNAGLGGVGGVGDGSKGSGGAGGHIQTSHSNNEYLYMIKALAGGAGGTYASNGGATAVTDFSFTTGAGVPTSTMFNNPATGYLYSDGDSYRDSWAGGGCSIGSGATSSSSAGHGGGGAGGRNNRNGGNGYCAFYY